MDSFSQKYNQYNLFSRRGFDEGEKKFTILLEIDSNKANKQNINQFYSVLKQLKESDSSLLADVGFVSVLRSRKGETYPIGVYLRDETSIVNRSIAAQSKNREEIRALFKSEEELLDQKHSYIYQYPQES